MKPQAQLHREPSRCSQTHSAASCYGLLGPQALEAEGSSACAYFLVGSQCWGLPHRENTEALKCSDTITNDTLPPFTRELFKTH